MPWISQECTKAILKNCQQNLKNDPFNRKKLIKKKSKVFNV